MKFILVILQCGDIDFKSAFQGRPIVWMLISFK